MPPLAEAKSGGRDSDDSDATEGVTPNPKKSWSRSDGGKEEVLATWLR